MKPHIWLAIGLLLGCSEDTSSQNSNGLPVPTTRPEPQTGPPSDGPPQIRSDTRMLQYSDDSRANPIRIGLATDVWSAPFLRSYFGDAFGMAGANVELYTGRAEKGDELYYLTRDFDLESMRKEKEQRGVISGAVLAGLIGDGSLDGAVMQTAEILLALHDGIPLRVVGLVAKCSVEEPCRFLASRAGLVVKGPADLKGARLVANLPGPTDELLLREYLQEAGLELATDATVVDSGVDAYRKMLAGDADAGIFSLFPMRGYVDQQMAMVGAPLGSLLEGNQSSFLVVSPQFVEERRDDIRRVLAGLKSRVDYEEWIPVAERKSQRAGEYSIDIEWNGVRIPQAKKSMGEWSAAFELVAAAMLEHGMLQHPVDIATSLETFEDVDGIVVGPRVPMETMSDEERARILASTAESLASVVNVHRSKSGAKATNRGQPLVDMAMGLDSLSSPGVLVRKMNEMGVSLAVVYHHPQKEDVLDEAWGVRRVFAERFLYSRRPGTTEETDSIANMVGPVTVHAVARNWRDWPDSMDAQSVERAVANAGTRPVLIQWEGFEQGHARSEFSSLLSKYSDVNFVWSHGGLVTPEDVKVLLSQHPNLFVLLSQIEPVLDVPAGVWPGQKTPTRSRDLPDDIEAKDGQRRSGKASLRERTSRDVNRYSVFTSVQIKGAQHGTVRMGRGRLRAPWSDVILEYPTQFVYGSELVTSFQYETRYRSNVIRFRQALRTLGEDTANKVSYENALRILGGAEEREDP